MKTLEAELGIREAEGKALDFDKLISELRDELEQQKVASVREMENLTAAMLQKNEEIEKLLNGKISL